MVIGDLTLADSKILPIINEATNFQGGKSLKNMLAKRTLDILKEFCINIYLGHSTYIAHNLETNFSA